MHNTPSILITAIILSLPLIAANVFCLANNTGPEDMELKTAAGTKPARFPHTKHQEKFGCKECHKQNKDSAPTRCTGCHIK